MGSPPLGEHPWHDCDSGSSPLLISASSALPNQPRMATHAIYSHLVLPPHFQLCDNRDLHDTFEVPMIPVTMSVEENTFGIHVFISLGILVLNPVYSTSPLSMYKYHNSNELLKYCYGYKSSKSGLSLLDHL